MFYLSSLKPNIINLIVTYYYYIRLTKIQFWLYSGLINDYSIGFVDEFERAQRNRKVIVNMCEGIIMLPGWKRSTRATGELIKAKNMGLDIIYIKRGTIKKLKEEFNTWSYDKKRQRIIRVNRKGLETIKAFEYSYVYCSNVYVALYGNII